MKWLLTVNSELSDAELYQILHKLRVVLSQGAEPIPMDDGVLYEVEGSDDLENRVRNVPGAVSVFPSSAMTLY